MDVGKSVSLFFKNGQVSRNLYIIRFELIERVLL